MTMYRKTRIALAIPAALALAAGGAAAHGADERAPAAAAAPAAQPAKVIITTPSALTVVRDPDTGELRAPTAEEAQALINSGRFTSFARTAVAPQRTFVTSSGGRGLTLGDATFGFSVARKSADGSVVEACVTGPEAAKRFLTAPKVSSEGLPNE